MSAAVKQSAVEEDFLPIRALNDLLFCERRCALHRIEQIWMDNPFTLEGIHGHQRADRTLMESGPGLRVVHGVLLQSKRLRLSGKADVVEFHQQPGGSENPYPIEYKRGWRRRWDNDDVQLCAQALCLEEMLAIPVPAGAVYHIKSKRRRAIEFTPDLRAKTETAAQRLHELVAAGITPPPVLKPRCKGCSLHDLCMPELLSQSIRVRQYHQRLFVAASPE